MKGNKSSNCDLFVFWVCFFSSALWILPNFALAALKPNQTISTGDTIISVEGTYELGFFNPSKGNKYYLGIWYKKISTGTVVWVANRDTPLTDPLGFMQFTKGSLEVVTSNGTVIWSSNSSKIAQNPIAELLDSGNFIIREKDDSDPENYLWQSFDYLSDTLLPGMKFGKNLVTGLEWFLTSWKSVDDPSPGNFSSTIEMSGVPQIIMRRNGVEYARSGPWNGIRFVGFSYQKENKIYSYEFISNKKEIYYYTNSSLYTRLVVTPAGLVQRYTWVDRTKNWSLFSNSVNDNCDTYAVCGVNGNCDINQAPQCLCLNGFVPKIPDDWARADFLNGCVRKAALDCPTDRFRKYIGLKLPDTRYSWVSASMNLDECKVACSKNCSCTAYTNSDIRNGGSGCLMWFGELIDMRKFNENGEDIYVRLAASEADDEDVHKTSKKRKGTMIAILVPLVVALMLFALAIGFIISWRKRKIQDRNGNCENGIDVGESTNGKGEAELPIYDFNTIASSTNDFSNLNKIGEGGFGPVYKGTLKGGQEIAVKRLSKSSTQGLDEFKNEVNYIAKLQHRNLVKLLGWCTHEEDRMLIYEYMPNKSLDRFIFDKRRCSLLDWPTRFNIINGIARGILYLHQDSRFRIVHRDLKVENILLDNEMIPKISDFGMARAFGGTQTQATTEKIVGTHGYIAPEYANRGLYSVKSDVYSFGVLVLEIVSGRRNRGFHHPGHSLDLLGHAWEYYWQERSLELVDEAIEKSCIVSEVLRCVQVGLLCVQQRAEERPNMSTVILMLGGEGAMPRPNLPAFFTGKYSRESDTSSSNFAACSGSELTFSDQLEPR